MNLPDVPLLSMLRTRMTWLNQRQDVLSQNVANADTPGFVARDLKPLNFNDSTRGPRIQAGRHARRDRSPPHQHPPGCRSAVSTKSRPMTWNPIPTAIRCRWKQEMIKVSDTQAQFQAAANLYAKAMNMMKTAIGQP